jgi:hypothetical protein
VCSTVPRESNSKLCITFIIWKEKERKENKGTLYLHCLPYLV